MQKLFKIISLVVGMKWSRGDLPSVQETFLVDPVESCFWVKSKSDGDIRLMLGEELFADWDVINILSFMTNIIFL